MTLEDEFENYSDYDPDEEATIEESMDAEMEQLYLEHIEDEVLFPDITADMIAEEITQEITDLING